jgi:phytoene dehydrogenase-like protein
MRPLVEHSSDLVELFLTGPAALPAAARASIGLALSAAREGTRWTRTPWRTEGAAALLAGVQAHVTGPLPSLPGAVIGLFLGHLAHHGGWPVVAGGSQAIAAALAADARAHGASIHTGYRVTDLADLPPARAVLLDVSPREFLRLAGPQMPSRYRAQLERFQYGPGAAKVDFLLSDPVPWLDPSTQEATTVHLGGTRREIYLQETLTARGVATERPFVLVVDPAAADPERATRNRRPLWAYAHVPHGSAVDPFDLVRARIEEHAPGFSETIQAHRSLSAAQYEGYNPNYVGGDIAGGALTLRQTVARPRLQRDPYRTPLPGVYLCSASTPPGPGVHGMCGYRAARAALRREFGVVAPIDLAPGEDSVPA